MTPRKIKISKFAKSRLQPLWYIIEYSQTIKFNLLTNNSIWIKTIFAVILRDNRKIIG